jgi:proteasome lid subunit RPN8/RPN11
MSFSIATTIRHLQAPRLELSCSWFLWQRLLSGLRERGRRRTRESGAFLLGTRERGRAHVDDFVLYDDLDTRCLDTGIVRFDGRHYGALWAHAERTHRSVVADVHVHPGLASQSDSDRCNPMIAQAGHIALILPNFAKTPLSHLDARAYVFEVGDRWRVVAPGDIRAFFFVGIP